MHTKGLIAVTFFGIYGSGCGSTPPLEQRHASQLASELRKEFRCETELGTGGFGLYEDACKEQFERWREQREHVREEFTVRHRVEVAAAPTCLRTEGSAIPGIRERAADLIARGYSYSDPNITKECWAEICEWRTAQGDLDGPACTFARQLTEADSGARP